MAANGVKITNNWSKKSENVKQQSQVVSILGHSLEQFNCSGKRQVVQLNLVDRENKKIYHTIVTIIPNKILPFVGLKELNNLI